MSANSKKEKSDLIKKVEQATARLERGLAYYEKGKVQQDGTSRWIITGSQPWMVKKGKFYSCNCPSAKPCKHIFAVWFLEYKMVTVKVDLRADRKFRIKYRLGNK